MATSFGKLAIWNQYTVDGSNPTNQSRLVVSPSIYRVYLHPRQCRISSINRAVHSRKVSPENGPFAATGDSEFGNPSFSNSILTGWWFQIFFIFTPIWGRFPFWLIFFKGVETTNQNVSALKTRYVHGKKFNQLASRKHESGFWDSDLELLSGKTWDVSGT